MATPAARTAQFDEGDIMATRGGCGMTRALIWLTIYFTSGGVFGWLLTDAGDAMSRITGLPQPAVSP